MLWLERLKRVLSSDAVQSNGSSHSRLPALEQHLADAAHALEANRARLRELGARAEPLTSEKRSTEEACSKLERDVDVALEEEREDLARYTLARLLERRRTLERLACRLTRVEEERENLERLVLEQQATLTDLQARARALWEERGDYGPERMETIDDEQVEIELLKYKRRRAAPAREAEEDSHE